MMRCEHCRSLLLDHLYGLLDPAEAAAVEDHLTGCPGCTAARAQAARGQDLIARAAKVPFPTVRFALPTDAEPARPADNGRHIPAAAPPASTRAPRQGRRSAWAHWAIAAGVLAMIPGTLLLLSGRAGRFESARQDVLAAADRLAEAKAAHTRAATPPPQDARLAAARAKHDAVVAEWTAAEKATDRAAADAPVAVTVTKPLAAQPGAPNDFAITVRDPKTALRGSRIEAEVRDQAGAVLFSQVIDRRGAAQPVRVPAGVWARVDPRAELFLSVAAVDEKTRTRRELLDPVRLYGPVYATMLVTDKTTYRPGERVYFRSLTLDRVTFRPPTHDQRLQYALHRWDGARVPGATTVAGTTALVRVAGSVVDPVTGPDGLPVRGVGCGVFVLPPGLADGDYALTLTERPNPAGVAPAVVAPVTRMVKVRAGAAERYAKQIGFAAPSYAPGQRVEAWAELKFQGKPVPGATATASATADGKPIEVIKPSGPATGPDGRIKYQFGLPAALPRGDVRFKVTFRVKEGGATIEESVAARVPVTGKGVSVEFFPEGGKLVAGVPNRVYVRGTTLDGKPVDVRGDITDDTGGTVRVTSPVDADEPGVNRGLGSFTFTPKASSRYRLTLDGNPTPFDLPPAEADGVAMTVLDPVTVPGEPVRVRLTSAGRERKLVIGAYTRGRLADTQTVTAGPGRPVEVKLVATPDLRGGVTRITVFEDAAPNRTDLAPVAERLVFRKPGEGLKLTLGTGAAGRGLPPGSPVDLTVAATDEKGNPVPAVLWAAAVNTAVAPGAKDRSLPTHFLLAGEVQTPDELEHADFLLTDHPQAAAALDHVLATQGWRRFVEQVGSEGVVRLPAGQRGPAAENLVAMNGQRPVSLEASPAGKRARLFETFWPRYEAAAKDLDEAQKTAGPPADRSAGPVARTLLTQYEDRRKDLADLTAAARSAAASVVAVRDRAGLVAGGVAVVAVLLGAVMWVRGSGSRGTLPPFLGATGAAGLALFLFFGWTEPEVAGLNPLPDEPSGDHAAPPGEKTPDQLPKPIPNPKQSEGPRPDDPIVKGPGIEKIGPEPGRPSTIGPMKSPNDSAGPTPRPKQGLMMAPPGPGANAGQLIPDDLLNKPGGTGRVTPRRPIPMRVMVPVAAAPSDEAAAAAFAEMRANGLIQRMNDALGGSGAAAPDPEAFDRVRAAVLPAPPLVVREYAAPRPGAAAGDGPAGDGDTILWRPVIVLPTDGKTTLSFHLGGAPGGYQVVVAGHTPDGRLGTVHTILPIVPAAKDSPAPPK